MPITSETVGMALGAANQVGQILGIGQKSNDRRQLKQQGKLMQQGINGQKELADYQQQLQMDMWHKTNMKAQVGELEKAGLNPGLIYGGSGAGGATTGGGGMPSTSGGQAANAAQTQQADTQMAMSLAQMRLIEAQTKKTETETVKIAGADTAESQARTTGLAFQNELNKSIGLDDMTKRYQWANDMLERTNAKELAEYNAWYASGFQGKATDDPTSPMAKAMSAGLEKTIVDLRAAKLANNAQELTNVVKAFEAELAKQGIHPHSPWWTKLLTDMLGKVGLTDMIQGGMKAIKTGG